MKFSIKTLLYLKNFSYFRIAKLSELAKLAMKDSEKIVSDSEISGISEISENSENPVIQCSTIAETFFLHHKQTFPE